MATQRTAVVTGGSSGIGKASAERLRRAGHRVVVFDIAEAPGVVTVDVTDEKDYRDESLA